MKTITSVRELEETFRSYEVEKHLGTGEFRVYQKDVHMANVTEQVWGELNVIAEELLADVR